MIVRIKTVHIAYRNRSTRVSWAQAGSLVKRTCRTSGMGVWGVILDGEFKGCWTVLRQKCYQELSALEQLAMVAE